MQSTQYQYKLNKTTDKKLISAVKLKYDRVLSFYLMFEYFISFK